MVVHFKEYTSENKVILMNFTDTPCNEALAKEITATRAKPKGMCSLGSQ